MKRVGDEDLFSEADLRRALRLEASELPPRLDPAALIARGTATRELGIAGIVSGLFAALAAIALVAVAVTIVVAVAPALASDLYSAAISLLVTIAVALDAALGAVEQPSIPIAVLAAVSFAIAYEYAQRKERANAVHTS